MLQTVLHPSHDAVISPLPDAHPTAPDDAEPLTVTLTLTLTGPDAAHAATRLVHALSETEPLRNTVWDGEIAQPTPLAPRATPTASRALKAVKASGPQSAPVVIDMVSRTVTVVGEQVRFTRREYDLLLFLTRHAGAAFTRLQLLRAVWGHEFSGERTVDVHVRRLRSKLGQHGPTIATVHGFGYRLDQVEQVSLRR